MRFLVFLFTTTLVAAPAFAQGPSISPVSPGLDIEPYRDIVEQIIEAATSDSAAYNRLAYLGDVFGHRLSGSRALEDAIDWILDEMETDGLSNVRGQPVMVPRWVRGEESAELVSPRDENLTMLALGGSIGTPEEGITAEVLVVSSFEDLEARASEAAGKIVLFNVPFTNYGETVQYRLNGATAAARAGAVASLIRSVAPFGMQTPHTGTMRYADDVEPIPHAAITIEGAALLQRLADRGERPVVTLKMDAHFEDDVLSRNVIGEIRGSERPEEVVVLGGHIDSWDVGTGMMDDGGGCVVAWEAVRILHDLGLQPRRTIRVVLWTNEENGLRGATVYRDSVMAAGQIENHVLAIESDGGVFAPVGFGFGGSDEAFAMLEPIAELLDPVLSEGSRGRKGVTRGGGGADIGPLMREGVPGMGLNTDSDRYFWYHHSPSDTIEVLTPDGVQRCAAAMAIMAYVVADMPERLPHTSVDGD